MIPLPKPPKIINKKNNSATFEIEGLYPGYGVTIGNSLRRVLLSSLEGAAVTKAKIKGVQHEFSTIPGVVEDVITIMMNFKKMRFRLHGDEPQTAYLKVKGLPAGKKDKEIKGSDFEFPTQVELVNKSCHIATITDKKADLEIEIQIERGVGYQPVEQLKKQKKSEVGVLFVDAIFTPVKKVSFRVENMRVGDRTDFDRLYLEITTDGIISPEEAFSLASGILVEHFSLFVESLPLPQREEKEESKDKKSKNSKSGKKESAEKKKKKNSGKAKAKK
ncbi:MAG TPA: DNA-directed RNA polymerase subunit alpha [Candidatus Parcubacteria bacterium]|nr:DNA-directed RNA polymerase subunit alpha [Candidatus Parcubacteria bacterium]